MADLADFGVDVTQDPPLCTRKKILRSPHTGKIAGFMALEETRPMRVYTTLRGRSHFYYEGDGYAISDDILDALQTNHISRIIVHEGTGARSDVYEFQTKQYVREGEAVPTHWLQDEDDTQTYVPLDEHILKWENHAQALFTGNWPDILDGMDEVEI